MSDLECVCGDCRHCRRAMRLDRPTVTEVTLGARAAAILAEPGSRRPAEEPVRAPEKKTVPPRPGKRRRIENGPNLTRRAKKAPEPTVCANCGGMRAVAMRGGGAYGHPYLTGSGDLCEVCMDRPKYEAEVAAHLALTTVAERTKNRTRYYRARHFLKRTLIDGRAYSPVATSHGNNTGYVSFGCRCEPCREWKTADNARRRSARCAA